MSNATTLIGDGLDAYGKFSTYLGLGVAGSVCIVLTIIGLFILFNNNNRTTGTIKSIGTCSSNLCSGTVALTDGTLVTVTNLSQNQTVGATIDLSYTNDNPPVYSANTPPKILGVGLISCGTLVCCIALLVTYLVSTSRTASQVVGGVTLVDQIAGLSR